MRFELLFDTSCHARRWAGFMIITTISSRGTPAITTRESRTSQISMKTAISMRLNISRTKFIMPFESASDTLLM